MSNATIPPNDAPILEIGANGKFTGRLDWRWRLYFLGMESTTGSYPSADSDSQADRGSQIQDAATLAAIGVSEHIFDSRLSEIESRVQANANIPVPFDLKDVFTDVPPPPFNVSDALLLALEPARQWSPSDDAYGAAWNGSTDAPTQNAVYDKIEAVVALLPFPPDTRTFLAQTADLGPTNFTAVAGTFRLNYYLVDTVADVAAGAVQLTISFTDDAGPTTRTSAAVALTGIGVIRDSGIFFIQHTATNISFAVAHTGIFGTAKYALYMTLERLS